MKNLFLVAALLLITQPVHAKGMHDLARETAQKVDRALIAQEALLSTNPMIFCTGQAEGGKIEIQQLAISKTNISIKYSFDGRSSLVREYVTTEFLERNGQTDLNSPAFFIGGTVTGNKKDYDDISLPNYGVYKAGLGSHIAFNHNSARVFGLVTCRQK